VALHQFTHRARTTGIDLSPKKGRARGDRQTCSGLSENLAILCNGEVTVCCCDMCGRMSLGNLHDYGFSVARLVENGRLERKIDEMDRNIFKGTCAHCSDWVYYQGNPDVAYVTVYPVSD